MSVFAAPYLALFLIITIGFMIGRIKINGISLDISAVIFVALLFGHFGIIIPRDFQDVGLVLFVFTIGLQAGPGFFQSFRANAVPLVSIAFLMIFVAAATTVFTAWLFDIDFELAIGLFTGALTSTPGLAAATDLTGSPITSIGYGLAYPFGVIGVVIFVRILPRIMNVRVSAAEEDIKKQLLHKYPEVLSSHFIVENENITGKTIGDLKIRSMTGASISRVMTGDSAKTPSPETSLHKGDLIRAVGTGEALEKIRLLVGSPTSRHIPLGEDYEIDSILVTNRKVVNKSIGELNLFTRFNATITRIRRSGIDIVPTDTTHIRFGDKLLVATNRECMKSVAALLGNQEKRLSDTDMLPIAAGIVLGVLFSKIEISYSENIIFSPGLAGGVLIIALLLGNLGKTGPFIWSMSASANQLLRQIGLLFFLAAVGTSAGAHIAGTFMNYGAHLIAAGIIITVMPLIASALLARYLLKINLLSLFGAITGSMTSTPGLAAIDPMTESNVPQTAYATVYPVAMVLLIIFVQILSLF
jgi:putative transport protein